MEIDPTFSLILGTKGRICELDRFLDSLCQQTYKDFELIVVDQSENDTDKEVKRLLSGRCFVVRYIRDTGRGLSRARNLGLRVARGRILAFPDDDCWYPETLLQMVATFFDNNPSYGILSGRYGEPKKPNPRFPSVPCPLELRTFGSCVSSITLFLNIKLLGKDVVHFHEEIGEGTALPSGEEIDLVGRLLIAGAKGYYLPNIYVFHAVERPSTTRKDLVLQRETADTYVLARLAWRAKNSYLWLKLLGRLLKPLFGMLLFRNGWNLVSARWRGFLAWLKRTRLCA